ncbi:hypothetical protein [Legionella shakespearei]|uniref:Chromosome partition protein Smc n=1 Tax=Legionella shakespearei DSM 23087 TaxID=1122169 RepID=A0A0W0YTJ8_9GAMM|nr:hypothetical protein [Legionella shakespearei]KTD60031.1 hypothetical protein Lsha_1781 [Legionella shakespearei DSM 23087]
MQSGSQILLSIDKGIDVIHSQIQTIDQQNNTQSQKLVALQTMQAERYKRMAKIRLDNVLSGELSLGLDRVSQRVDEILKERVKAIHMLQEQIKSTKVQMNDHHQQRAQLHALTIQATERLDTAEAATQNRLKGEPAYLAQLEKAETAARVAKHADDKMQQAQSAREQKGKPYENEQLFMYLWQRSYGTSQYKANPFIRFLDKWVARLCDFDKARPNYAMLLEIPKRLSEHAQRLLSAADLAFAELIALEKKAAEEDGIPELKKSMQQAQEKLDQCDHQIEDAEKHLQALEMEQSAFSSGDDAPFKEAIKILSSTFEQEPVQVLQDYARATTTTEDDLLVQEMDATKVTTQQIQQSVTDNKRVQQRYLERMRELQDIRNRFKQQHFDSIHSEFINSEGLAMQLNQFLQGMISASILWSTIQREQRYRKIEANPGFGSGGFEQRQGTWHFPFPRNWGGGTSRGNGGGSSDGGFTTGGGF